MREYPGEAGTDATNGSDHRHTKAVRASMPNRRPRVSMVLCMGSIGNRAHGWTESACMSNRARRRDARSMTFRIVIGCMPRVVTADRHHHRQSWIEKESSFRFQKEHKEHIPHHDRYPLKRPIHPPYISFYGRMYGGDMCTCNVKT